MAAEIPAWLNKKLGGAHARYANLAVARLADERNFERGGFALSSPAFSDGEQLDPCFTADEEDAVAPPLEWTAPPPGAMEIAIVVEDADGPGGEPMCHWLVWGLPAQKGMLLEGEVPPRVGKNSLGNSEWLLPQPAHEDDAHRYVFQAFALDLPLTLMPGADRSDLMKAIDGHVVAASVMSGLYKREEEGDAGWDEDDRDDE